MTPPESSPRKKVRHVEVLVVICALTSLIIVQYKLASQASNKVKELQKSPVYYSELEPEDDTYHPGDLITFNYTRYATVKNEPLLMLVTDTFEDLDTGELYSAIVGSRIITEGGTKELKASRRLSPDAKPGTYRLAGWSSVQNNITARTEAYLSDTFQVEAREAKPAESPNIQPQSTAHPHKRHHSKASPTPGFWQRFFHT